MARRVALARRNLFQDRRRAALSIVGVAAALLLVLVLEGIFAGAMQQVTAYVRNSPADVFVAQEGARTMHMTQTALPPDTVESVAAVEGVAWAEGLRYTTSIVDAGDGQRTAYVFGYDADGRGGPARLSAGSSPGVGEIVVDDVAAAELDIQLGDTVRVFGAEFRVSGLSTEGTNIVNTTSTSARTTSPISAATASHTCSSEHGPAPTCRCSWTGSKRPFPARPPRPVRRSCVRRRWSSAT
jgi:putative ABC transport system permease protein